MSFSQDVKLEILEGKLLRSRHWKATAVGLLSAGNSFSAADISLRTRYPEVAKAYDRAASKLLDATSSLTERVVEGLRGQEVIRVWVKGSDDRRQIIELIKEYWASVSQEEALGPFLAGAYLSCGNVTDPEKGYHLEFVLREKTRADALLDLLQEAFPGFRLTTRRGQQVVYCKECAQIEDLLTLIGASRACLSMIDVEMIKGVRNQANRATNCETANIEKQVNAAAGQVADIALVLHSLGEESLTPQLREAAVLRMNNPEGSLRELCEDSGGKVSRSGLYHRLAALGKMAEEIRLGGKADGK